jgi:hypothetical protein
MYRWNKPDIFEEVASSLEYRLGEQKFAKLKQQFYRNLNGSLDKVLQSQRGLGAGSIFSNLV